MTPQNSAPDVTIHSDVIGSGLPKFTVGEVNHVRSKVIGVINSHRPLKPTLSSMEIKALKELRNDQNLVISKADKGGHNSCFEQNRL